jgi:hypothetical protein
VEVVGLEWTSLPRGRKKGGFAQGGKRIGKESLSETFQSSCVLILCYFEAVVFRLHNPPIYRLHILSARKLGRKEDRRTSCGSFLIQ